MRSIIHFTTFLTQITKNPLTHMHQFVQQSLNVKFLCHKDLKFNQETSWTYIIVLKVTPSINQFTFESTMHNTHIKTITWQKSIQKPSGNILTDPLVITISRIRDVRLHNQCRNQTKDEMKISLSVVVIYQVAGL